MSTWYCRHCTPKPNEANITRCSKCCGWTTLAARLRQMGATLR